MSWFNRTKRYARRLKAVYVRAFIHLTRKIKLPGFQGISLWEIIFFFIYSLKRGLIGMRAGAVSFHFFLALIPFGLVLVVLTSYIPGVDLEQDIAPVISALVPEMLFERFMSGLHEYENSTVRSLLSFGFVLAIYFTSNGFSQLIKAFNISKMKFEKREKWWQVRLLSIGFVLVFIVAIMMTFYLLIFVRKGFIALAERSEFVRDYFNQIYGATDFLFLSFLVYCGISLMYYFGPKERKGFRFFSPGATLAFVLVMVISILYELYISSYATYNDLYGSLGTIIMIMLWVYMISFALLIGFELNASIQGAMAKKRLADMDELEKRYEKTN